MSINFQPSHDSVTIFYVDDLFMNFDEIIFALITIAFKANKKMYHINCVGSFKLVAQFRLLGSTLELLS